MKKMALLAITAVLCSTLFAQNEEPSPKKHDATWHRVVFVNFKAGKAGEANDIIKKYESAAVRAGTPQPEKYWFETGPYDLMLIWDLKGGPADLEWKWSPDGVNWWKALVDQEGSEEAADELRNRYSDLVANSTSQLIRQEK